MHFDGILTEGVRSGPLLSDLAHSDYKNLKMKDFAWKEVAAKTKLSELESKKRWKSLRDSSKRCKRLDQIASGSSAESLRRKWKYYRGISFSENVPNSRRTIGSMSADIDLVEEGKMLEVIDVDSANIPVSASDSSKLRIAVSKR